MAVKYEKGWRSQQGGLQNKQNEIVPPKEETEALSQMLPALWRSLNAL
jgi:hypothetical protein